MAIVNRKFDIPRASLDPLVVMAGNILALERACGGKFKLCETRDSVDTNFDFGGTAGENEGIKSALVISYALP